MLKTLKFKPILDADLDKTKQRLSEFHSSASLNDQLVRELQSRESDLMEALGAKDSQLAILRVRLEEADKDVLRKSQNLQNLETERSRFVNNVIIVLQLDCARNLILVELQILLEQVLDFQSLS